MNEAMEQIAFADRLILNKTDLVSEAELIGVRSRIRALNELAEIKTTTNAVRTSHNTRLAPPPAHTPPWRRVIASTQVDGLGAPRSFPHSEWSSFSGHVTAHGAAWEPDAAECVGTPANHPNGQTPERSRMSETKAVSGWGRAVGLAGGVDRTWRRSM